MNIRLYKKSPGGMAGGGTRAARPRDRAGAATGRGGGGIGHNHVHTVWYMSDKKQAWPPALYLVYSLLV